MIDYREACEFELMDLCSRLLLLLQWRREGIPVNLKGGKKQIRGDDATGHTRGAISDQHYEVPSSRGCESIE